MRIVNTNIYNSHDLLKSLFIFFNLKFIKILFLFDKFLKIIKYFLKFSLNWDYSLIYNKLNIFIYSNFNVNDFLHFKEIKNHLFDSLIYNYYKNDIISKNSKNLNLASIEFINSFSILN
jgi:hypothetical protein